MSDRMRGEWLDRISAGARQLRNHKWVTAAAAAVVIGALITIPLALSSGGGGRRKVNVGSGVTTTMPGNPGAAVLGGSDGSQSGVGAASPAASTTTTTRPPAPGTPSPPGAKPGIQGVAPDNGTPTTLAGGGSRPQARLAYTSGPAIVAVDEAGTGRSVEGKGEFLADPQWSPDGNFLAYVDTEGSGPPIDVYVTSAGSGQPHKVASNLFTSSEPSWSPDGKSVAVYGIASAGAPGEIFVANVEGTVVRQVTSGATQSDNHVLPEWSPDGTQIAYVCGGYDICTVKPDGTGNRRLAVSATNSDIAWSPDSKRIAFYGSSTPAVQNLWTVRADGTDLQQIATGTQPYDARQRVTWAPDGKSLAFDTAQGVTLVGSGGQGRRILAPGAKEPTFAPDGTRLAVTRDNAIVVVGLDGGVTPVPDAAGRSPQYRRG